MAGMSYKILILRSAQRALSQLPLDAFNKACKIIRSLDNNPRPPGSIKLTGRDGWRIRMGDYRIIYKINNRENTITILHIGHRKNIYR